MSKMLRKLRKQYRAIGGKRVFASLVALLLVLAMVLPLLWTVVGQ